MTAHEVLLEARRRGIELTPGATTLRFRGPEDALNEEFKRELKRHKPEILALLKEAWWSCAGCQSFAFPEEGTLCYWCRKGPHEA